MSEEKWFAVSVATFFVTFVGGLIASMMYSSHLRHECMLANTQRSAGDVIAICGKP